MIIITGMIRVVAFWSFYQSPWYIILALSKKQFKIFFFLISLEKVICLHLRSWTSINFSSVNFSSANSSSVNSSEVAVGLRISQVKSDSDLKDSPDYFQMISHQPKCLPDPNAAFVASFAACSVRLYRLCSWVRS